MFVYEMLKTNQNVSESSYTDELCEFRKRGDLENIERSLSAYVDYAKSCPNNSPCKISLDDIKNSVYSIQRQVDARYYRYPKLRTLLMMRALAEHDKNAYEALKSIDGGSFDDEINALSQKEGEINTGGSQGTIHAELFHLFFGRGDITIDWENKTFELLGLLIERNRASLGFQDYDWAIKYVLRRGYLIPFQTVTILQRHCNSELLRASLQDWAMRNASLVSRSKSTLHFLLEQGCDLTMLQGAFSYTNKNKNALIRLILNDYLEDYQPLLVSAKFTCLITEIYYNKLLFLIRWLKSLEPHRRTALLCKKDEDGKSIADVIKTFEAKYPKTSHDIEVYINPLVSLFLNDFDVDGFENAMTVIENHWLPLELSVLLKWMDSKNEFDQNFFLRRLPKHMQVQAMNNKDVLVKLTEIISDPSKRYLRHRLFKFGLEAFCLIEPQALLELAEHAYKVTRAEYQRNHEVKSWFTQWTKPEALEPQAPLDEAPLAEKYHFFRDQLEYFCEGEEKISNVFPKTLPPRVSLTGETAKVQSGYRLDIT